MSTFNCKTCGASLEVSAFSSTAICEYCGTTNDLKRDNLQRLSSTSTEISPEEYKKQLDRAAASFEKGFYDKALEVLESLKAFTLRDISFSTIYAQYFLVAKFNQLVGKRGEIERSWTASCDHSGNYMYSDYACPDFELVFHDFENLMEDAEELIATGDSETSKSYANQIILAIESIKLTGKSTVNDFIERYGYTAERKTKSVKIGDDWVTKEYIDHDRNDQAEQVAIEMAKDITSFYSNTYLRLLDKNLIKPQDVDFAPIYSFLKHFREDKGIPHCLLKKVRFEDNIGSEITDSIEAIYDYNLIKDHNASHPLGSSVRFEKLCNYSEKIRSFAKKYVDQGLIASSLVESMIQKNDSIRDDALTIRKIYRYGFWFSIPIGIGIAFIPATWAIGAAWGLWAGTIGATLYGRKTTGDVHTALEDLAIISERNIRAEATRRKYAQSN